MAQASIKVGAIDRLSFTLFLALAVHAMLLFGVSFDLGDRSKIAPTLDVTLTQHKSEEVPEEADFLAQSNQLGSGTLDEAKKLTTTEIADFEDNIIREVQPEEQAILIKETQPDTYRIISSIREVEPISLTLEMSEEELDAITAKEMQILENLQEIASLNAVVENKRQSYANRPRIRTLSTVSTKRADDAEYSYNVLQKVLRVGNNNYPIEAKKKRLTGLVVVRIAILADGSLREASIVRSSGSTVLDESIKRIIYQAAPFDSFPETIRADTDILELSRGWRFEIDTLMADE